MSRIDRRVVVYSGSFHIGQGVQRAVCTDLSRRSRCTVESARCVTVVAAATDADPRRSRRLLPPVTSWSGLAAPKPAQKLGPRARAARRVNVRRVCHRAEPRRARRCRDGRYRTHKAGASIAAAPSARRRRISFPAHVAEVPVDRRPESGRWTDLGRAPTAARPSIRRWWRARSKQRLHGARKPMEEMVYD